MSEQTPIIYLPLDDGANGETPNIGRIQAKATVSGAVVVSDPLLGRCFSFDGKDDFIALPEMTIDARNGFTVSAWVYYEQFQHWSRIIDFGNGEGQSNVLLANNGTTNQLSLLNFGLGRGFSHLDAPNVLVQRQWMHITATMDASGWATLYLNGRLLPLPPKIMSKPTNLARRNMYVARSNWAHDSYFHGKMAHLRVYDRGLSADEIQRDMRNSRLGLTVHLKLNAALEQYTPDATQNGLSGDLQGDPRLVADDTFGSCLDFDGVDDAIIIPHHEPETEVTHMLWFKTRSANCGLLSATSADGGAHDRHIFLSNGQLKTRIWKADKSVPPANLTVTDGQWHHIAHVFGASVGGQQLYIDGNMVRGEGDRSDFTWQQQIRIGYSADANPTFFRGQMAHVRLYRRALSAAEIAQARETDLLGMPAFRKSHPIAFTLHDKDDHHAIYIDDDPADQTLILDLHNTSGQTLMLNKGNGNTASATNYHVALRFRPGTLSTATFTQLQCAENKDWSLAVAEDNSAVARNATIYLLYSGANRVFAADERRSLTLQRISAAAGQGARGTQVELQLSQITYESDPHPLTGSRLAHISVVNHQGKKQIPLHLGFVGSNTILNDGVSANARTLRLTNTSAADGLRFDTNTRLILSFDAQAQGEQKEWALGSAAQVGAIEVTADGWNVQKVSQGQSTEWIITPLKPLTLVPRAAVQFGLTTIISSLPTGSANLYLRYENIPGYWDGQFICVIEKSPLLFRDGYVGLGVADSNRPLTIGSMQRNPKSANVEIRGAGNHSWGIGLVMRTTGGIDGAAILFRNRDQKNWQLRGETNGAGFQITEDGGDGEYGQGHGTPRMHLSAGGNLGLGTTTPQAMLHISGGNVRIENGRLGIGTAPPEAALHLSGGNLRIDNGKVGIGIPDPREALETNGTIVAGNLALGGRSRGALYFGSPGDTNHMLYNNGSNIDGQGGWDGMKWNVFGGLDIRAGGGRLPTIFINDSGKTQIRGEFEVQAGQVVSGIPVIEIQRQTQSFSGHKDSLKSLDYYFTFSQPVAALQPMVASWRLEYHNHSQVNTVGVDCDRWSSTDGLTWKVNVQFHLRDNPRHYDDMYGGSATVVVIAVVRKAL